MNRHHGIRRRLAVLAAIIGFAAAAPLKAAEPNWPGGPYNYFVVDQDLRAVLHEFGRHLNVPVSVSESVPAIRLKGKLGAPGARDFLQWICESYRLVWFYDGAVIHVIPQSEVRNEFYDLGMVTAAAFWNRLEKAGIADARFPVRPTADERIVAIFGPPAYHATVRNALASMNQAAAAIVPVETPPPARSPAPAEMQAADTPVAPAQKAPLPYADTSAQDAIPSDVLNVAATAAIVPETRPPALQNMAVELPLPRAEKRSQERLQEQKKEDKKVRESRKVTVFRGGRP